MPGVIWVLTILLLSASANAIEPNTIQTDSYITSDGVSWVYGYSKTDDVYETSSAVAASANLLGPQGSLDYDEDGFDEFDLWWSAQADVYGTSVEPGATYQVEGRHWYLWYYGFTMWIELPSTYSYWYMDPPPPPPPPPPSGCGDERDQIIQEYIDYGVNDGITNFIPQCSWFTQTAHSEYFLFVELKVDNPYSWALIGQPLTVDKSSGYGLDRWRQLWGAARISDSGYRSPYHNAHLVPPGAARSRHMWGDAIDLRNETRTEEEYNAMASRADRQSQQPNAGADYVEPQDGPCGLGCVHADWRNTAGPYSQ